MESIREKLFDELNNKVIGLDWADGTYLYNLTRVKEAFHIGTMTFDDFVEVDHELIDEILDVVMPVIEKLQKKVESLEEELESEREYSYKMISSLQDQLMDSYD